MNEKYVYGKQNAAVEGASGVSGVLIKTTDGSFSLRVYNPGKTFTDYEIRHDDLPIRIEDSLSSSFAYREAVIRIISSRKASPGECRRYEKQR